MNKDNRINSQESCVKKKDHFCLLQGEEGRSSGNEGPHNLYASPSIIREIEARRVRWVGHVARFRCVKNVYEILVGKPEDMSPLGRHRRKWEDNIRMDLGEIGCASVEWIRLAQDGNQWRTLLNTVMKFWVL
jgi:hypothetical protein